MTEKSQRFQFKHFAVANHLSAMKVNTDGVLLGAWVRTADISSAWDIGTGTGVIALMLAQRFPKADIYAVEVDAPSAQEAAGNFRESPWTDRLHLVEGDFAKTVDLLPKPDLIVCNPPFFDVAIHNLVSPFERKACARHEDSLSYESLIRVSADFLKPSGRLCFVSPADREADIELAATLSQLQIAAKTYVRTVPAKSPKRILWDLTPSAERPASVSNMSIRDCSGNFTSEYKELLNDFYINF